MVLFRNMLRLVAVVVASGSLMSVSCNPITPPDSGSTQVNRQDSTCAEQTWEPVLNDTVSHASRTVTVAQNQDTVLTGPDQFISEPDSALYEMREVDTEVTPELIDGRVTMLQTHSQGNGVNIVIMGDAFTETQNADGTYETVMRRAAEAFFSVEPYTTFRYLFDVYMVNVVSQSDDYSDSGLHRRLGTWFGDCSHVGGDDKMCKRYALHAVRPERDDWQDVEYLQDTEISLGNTLVIVVMNSSHYAGTCYMGVYRSEDSDTGVTQGNSVAYISLGSDEEEFEAILHHEAGGHGFGYLADEYFYPGTGTITDSEIDEYRSWQDNFHVFHNIDFISDTTQVRWSCFLADSRYADEGLGVFEGAGGYFEHGVYKPTGQSIMCGNVGGFNAPSREQIYKRLLKLAYGMAWNFDYDRFVAYDSVNSMLETKGRRRQPPLPPTGRSVVRVLGE